LGTTGRTWKGRPRWIVAAVAVVAAVLTLGVVMVQRTLSAQAEGVAVMNVGGRQRMLSQRPLTDARGAAVALAPDRAGRADCRQRLGQPVGLEVTHAVLLV
jgi:hypothetical protein